MSIGRVVRASDAPGPVPPRCQQEQRLRACCAVAAGSMLDTPRPLGDTFRIDPGLAGRLPTDAQLPAGSTRAAAGGEFQPDTAASPGGSLTERQRRAALIAIVLLAALLR